jgi:polyribonucleotide nucleotidyltransferase
MKPNYNHIHSMLYYSFSFVILIPTQIDFLVGRQIEVGKVYKGVVSSVKEYGAFIELNGGQHGLLHISELSHDPVIDSTEMNSYR